MILVILLIGVVIIIAAVRNSQGALFTALGEDVPGFVAWAAAIFALGAVGWIPGLKPISRGLLALVIVVLIFHNYKQILAGFSNAWQHPPAVGTGASTSTVGTLSMYPFPAPSVDPSTAMDVAALAAGA